MANNPNTDIETGTVYKRRFILGASVVAAGVGLVSCFGSKEEPTKIDNNVEMEKPVPVELISAIKNVINKHNASLPEAKEQALSEFKKSSPDGEGRIVKVGDIFQIHQDPATSGEYRESYCNISCISFEDFKNDREPEIVANTLGADEASLSYTSNEFIEAVLNEAFWVGAITHPTAGNDSDILATYDPSSDRVCQERQKVEYGKVSDETFQDCFFAATLPQSAPLAADIATIKAFIQTVSASPTPAP